MAEKKKKDPYKKMKDTLKLASQAAANGWPTEQVNQGIIDAGYKSVKAFERAVINHASIGINKLLPQSEKAAIRGNMREVANGISFGLWDRAESMVNAILDDTPYREGEGFSEKWDYHKDLIGEERKDYQDMQPVISTISNLAGAGLTGAALYKAAISAFPALAGTAGAPWWNAGKEAAVEGAIGTLEGGLTAAATGGDVGKGATFGGAVGGIAGPIATRIIDPAVRYAKQGIKKVKEFFDLDDLMLPPEKIIKEPTIPEKRALDKMERTYEEEGVTPEMRETKIRQFEEADLEEVVSPGYVGGESTTQMAQDAVAAPGPAKQKVKEKLIDDLEADRARVQEGMKKGLGFSEEGSPQTMNAMMAKMRADAKPMYDEAYSSPPIYGDDTIDEIMSLPEFKKAYQEALDANRHALPEDQIQMFDLPEEGAKGTWSIASMDLVKQVVDNLVKLPPSAVAVLPKKKARNLSKQLERMLVVVDEYSPAYGRARQTWGGGAAEKDAYELGMDAYRPGKSAAEVRADWDKLKEPSEKEMFRLGASTEAVTKMDIVTAPTKGHSKIMSSPENLKKHKILFGDEAAAKQFSNRVQLLGDVHKKAGESIPKSPTAPLLNRFISGAIDLATTGGITSKAVSLGRMVSDPLQMVQQRATNRAVGGLISTRGADPTRRVMDQMAARKTQLSQEIIDRAVRGGGMSSAAAHLLGDEGESLVDQQKKQGLLAEEDIWSQ